MKTEEKKKPKDSKPQRKKRIEARVTDQEYATIAKKAAVCYRTMSDYFREVALGHEPRQHMTEREIEALSMLAAARSDLVRIASRANKIPPHERARYFNDPDFIEKWMRVALPIIKRMKEIDEYFSSSIIPQQE